MIAQPCFGTKLCACPCVWYNILNETDGPDIITASGQIRKYKIKIAIGGVRYMSVDSRQLAWEEVNCEHIVQNEWIDFRKSSFRFPNGEIFEPYYSYSRRDYAVIVASDTEGRYICVRQFRQGIKEVTTEFPAGGMERKDGREYRTEKSNAGSEDGLAAAKRELREETGYESDEWEHLITVPSNATIADNYAYIFTARNCRKVSEQELDETEFLNVEKHTADELEEMIHGGRFQQSIHIMAWLLAKEGAAQQ